MDPPIGGSQIGMVTTTSKFGTVRLKTRQVGQSSHLTSTRLRSIEVYGKNQKPHKVVIQYIPWDGTEAAVSTTRQNRNCT